MAKKKRELPNKTQVRQALLVVLEKNLATMVNAAKDAAEGATHEENRSEGDKDMRATEQSYVARGQAMRSEQLAEDVSRLQTASDDAQEVIAAYALVLLQIDDEERCFYLSAQGAGSELLIEKFSITVISPVSPLGSRLLGKRQGDDFEFVMRGRERECEVLALT